VCFTFATAVFLLVDSTDLLRLRSPWFWLLVGTTLLGSVAGQMRGIVLSTCVTLLVPEDQRDRANGMVGTVTGFSFAITSVFSGLVIGGLGMGWAYYNLAFIAGGLAVARFGLGSNPLRVVLAGNLVNWTVCSVFEVRSSIVLVGVGMFVRLALIPVIETGKQTILQRSIPYERQGPRVRLRPARRERRLAARCLPDGAARRVHFHTPHVRRPWRRPDRAWFGTGPDRGITLAGLVGVAVTVLAWTSRSYRRLVPVPDDA